MKIVFSAVITSFFFSSPSLHFSTDFKLYVFGVSPRHVTPQERATKNGTVINHKLHELVAAQDKLILRVMSYAAGNNIIIGLPGSSFDLSVSASYHLLIVPCSI